MMVPMGGTCYESKTGNFCDGPHAWTVDILHIYILAGAAQSHLLRSAPVLPYDAGGILRPGRPGQPPAQRLQRRICDYIASRNLTFSPYFPRQEVPAVYKICKTEASAARQRAIEEALLAAMAQEPYEKISLNRLCGDLGMPRKTLYRYFPTKQDILLGLIDHRLADCNALVFSDWEGNSQYEKTNMRGFFSFWLEQRPFLDAIVENRLWPLLLERTTCIVDTMKQTSTEPRQQSFARDQVEYFVSHGLMATVLRWHSRNYPSSPEEMAETFAAILCAPELSISRLFL